MNLDDLHLWLNDRIGREVVAGLWIALSEHADVVTGTVVLEVKGELQHVSHPRSGKWHYVVGDMWLYLGDLTDELTEVSLDEPGDDPAICLDLDERTRLQFMDWEAINQYEYFGRGDPS